MSGATRYLLDTNVISETRRKQPDPGLIRFLEGSTSSSLYLSVLTVGELRKGASMKRRSDPRYARELSMWIDTLESEYADRLVMIDAAVTRVWGEISAERSRPVVDTLLAASAMVHQMTFVTRNTGDVQDLKVKLMNPWTA